MARVLDRLCMPFALALGLSMMDGHPAEGTWATLLLWSLDLRLGFLTGLFRDGEFIVRPGEVACHYLRTHFPPNPLTQDQAAEVTDTYMAIYVLGANVSATPRELLQRRREDVKR